MNDNPFTPDEQAIINELRSARKPRIKPEVAAAIREQMLTEFRSLPQQSSPIPRRLPTRVLLAAAALVGWIFLALLLPHFNAKEIIPTVPPTSVALVESQTPTSTPSPSATKLAASITLPPTDSSTPTTTPEILVVIEGEVSAIDDDTLTIYNFDIPIAPQHPILNLIEVGDFIHVEGTYDAGGTFVLAAIGNLPETTIVSAEGTSVGLEGMVEAIEDNILTVNSIPVQLEPDDPFLQLVSIGDFVSIEGNFETNSQTIVLVAVKITIRADVTEIENDCWYHDAMGMGHWHCDGMGMGDEGMGMGDDGMGMGMGG
jgi:hypothetical protein